MLDLFIPIVPVLTSSALNMASNFSFSPHAPPFAFLNCLDDLKRYETRGHIFLSFMDYDSNNDHIILGPYRKSTPAPPVFTECFLRHFQEIFPISKGCIHAHAWLISNYRFNSYPSFDKRFFQWYQRLYNVMKPQ